MSDQTPKGDRAAPRDRKLEPAAARALAEADERRRLAKEVIDQTTTRPKELNGRGGTEPVRYGDWEVKGLATDF